MDTFLCTFLRNFLCIFVVLTILYKVNCYPGYADLIPNGRNVTDPCNSNIVIGALGHVNPIGGGDRNQFGNDFFTNNKVWNITLCQKDSDGDNLTNGVELGDPYCLWDAVTKNSSVLVNTVLTHPGSATNTCS